MPGRGDGRFGAAALLAAFACLALLASGCGSSGGGDTETGSSAAKTTTSGETANSDQTATPQQAATRGEPTPTIQSGPPPKKLVTHDLIVGTGPEAKAGDEVTVQYLGLLYEGGQKFDASWDRNEPFVFALGSGAVIPGWEEGIVGMRVGGRRELIVPPALGYGSQATGTIPPNSTLVFIVDLLAAE